MSKNILVFICLFFVFLSCNSISDFNYMPSNDEWLQIIDEVEEYDNNQVKSSYDIDTALSIANLMIINQDWFLFVVSTAIDSTRLYNIYSGYATKDSLFFCKTQDTKIMTIEELTAFRELIDSDSLWLLIDTVYHKDVQFYKNLYTDANVKDSLKR